MDFKNRVALKILGLFLLLTCSRAVVTPAVPPTLPLEGNGYRVFTPPKPSIVPDLNSCDIFKCKADEVCYRAEGARPYCRPKDDVCAPIKCRLDCKYGLKKDSEGCPECACLDPCKGVTCTEGFECLPDKFNGRLMGVCYPISDCIFLPCSLDCDWGFTKDSFGCPVCACYDPCHEVDCGSNECKRIYNAIEDVYEAQCPKSEDVCKTEKCYKWCGIKRFKNNHEDEKLCASCNCLQPCMDLDCEEGEVCNMETKSFCQDGDICYNYQVPFCDSIYTRSTANNETPGLRTTYPPTDKPTFPILIFTTNNYGYTKNKYIGFNCFNGYARSGEECENPCNKCLDYEHCVINSNHKLTCEACEIIRCPESCKFGCIKDENGCNTGQCETDACANIECSKDTFCVPTHYSKDSYRHLRTHMCIPKGLKACTAISNHVSHFDCDGNGGFKVVQLIGKDLICVDSFGRLKGKGYDCYKNGIVKLTVSIENYIINDAFKKGLSSSLARYYLLSENEVVVSQPFISTIHSKSKVEVLLLANNKVPLQLLRDLTVFRPPIQAYGQPQILFYEVYFLEKNFVKKDLKWDICIASAVVMVAIFFVILAAMVILAKNYKKRSFRKNWVSAIVSEEKPKDSLFTVDKKMSGYTEI